jgi:class 3 adenylate cyclase
MRQSFSIFRFPASLEEEFLEDYNAKSLAHIRLALVVGTSIYAAFGVIDLLILPEARSLYWGVRFLVCLVSSLVWLCSFADWFPAYSQRLCSGVVFAAGAGLIAISLGAISLTIDLYHAGFLILITYCHTFIKLRFLHAIIVSLSLSLIRLAVDLWLDPPLIIFVNNLGYFIAANAMGMFASYAHESYMRKDFLHDRQIKMERDRSEQLLLNILPHSIVQRLKADNYLELDRGFMRVSNELIADNFTEVTVLFADIVNFTQLASTISPRELVSLLNQVFSAFDRIAEQYELEKIKTIGDAYMVVGGLPQPRADHAIAIANMALEMQKITTTLGKELGFNLQIRIGINTGAVVAGIIGIKKFIYDLWGDTVNIASRMESSSVIGEIQVSQSTYEYLSDSFEFESRGEIELKGKGKMHAYLLKGRKSNPFS